MKENGWSQQQHDLVDWPAHCRVINRHQTKQTTVVKMINDILPTGARVHKYDPKYSHRCPACHAPEEDSQHMMRCQHEERQQWRTTLIEKVKETALSKQRAHSWQRYFAKASRRGWRSANPISKTYHRYINV
jgi:hypothetical protein